MDRRLKGLAASMTDAEGQTGPAIDNDLAGLFATGSALLSEWSPRALEPLLVAQQLIDSDLGGDWDSDREPLRRCRLGQALAHEQGQLARALPFIDSALSICSRGDNLQLQQLIVEACSLALDFGDVSQALSWLAAAGRCSDPLAPFRAANAVVVADIAVRYRSYEHVVRNLDPNRLVAAAPSVAFRRDLLRADAMVGLRRWDQASEMVESLRTDHVGSSRYRQAQVGVVEAEIALALADRDRVLAICEHVESIAPDTWPGVVHDRVRLLRARLSTSGGLAAWSSAIEATSETLTPRGRSYADSLVSRYLSDRPEPSAVRRAQNLAGDLPDEAELLGVDYADAGIPNALGVAEDDLTEHLRTKHLLESIQRNLARRNRDFAQQTEHLKAATVQLVSDLEAARQAGLVGESANAVLARSAERTRDLGVVVRKILSDASIRAPLTNLTISDGPSATIPPSMARTSAANERYDPDELDFDAVDPQTLPAEHYSACLMHEFMTRNSEFQRLVPYRREWPAKGLDQAFDNEYAVIQALRWTLGRDPDPDDDVGSVALDRLRGLPVPQEMRLEFQWLRAQYLATTSHDMGDAKSCRDWGALSAAIAQELGYGLYANHAAQTPGLAAILTADPLEVLDSFAECAMPELGWFGMGERLGIVLVSSGLSGAAAPLLRSVQWSSETNPRRHMSSYLGILLLAGAERFADVEMLFSRLGAHEPDQQTNAARLSLAALVEFHQGRYALAAELAADSYRYHPAQYTSTDQARLTWLKACYKGTGPMAAGQLLRKLSPPVWPAARVEYWTVACEIWTELDDMACRLDSFRQLEAAKAHRIGQMGYGFAALLEAERATRAAALTAEMSRAAARTVSQAELDKLTVLSVAHDLTNTLTSMGLLIEVDLQLDRGREISEAQARPRFDRVCAFAERALLEVESLHDLSRPGHRSENDRRNASEAISNLLDWLRPEIELKDISVVIDLTDDNPSQVPAGFWEQSVGNVLRNAVQVSPNHGEIVISMWNDGQALHVRVDDAGPGISEEQWERIFEPFVSNLAGTGRTGTGLGLHLARTAVSAAGGTISASSAGHARGARFEIVVPAPIEVDHERDGS